MIEITLYGGCYRCHSRTSFRRRVRRPGLRAEECISTRDCQRRTDESFVSAYVHAAVREACDRALAAALGGTR